MNPHQFRYQHLRLCQRLIGSREKPPGDHTEVERDIESLQQLRQIFCPQVRIAFQHLQGLVSSDGGNLHRIKSFLKEATGGLVTEVVETQIFYFNAFAGGGK